MLLKSLPFQLPTKWLEDSQWRFAELSKEIQQFAKRSGTQNPKFLQAWEEVFQAVNNQRPLETVLQNRFHMRALSIALGQKKLSENIVISAPLIRRFKELSPNPTSLFIEAVYQYFLTHFTKVSAKPDLCQWLLEARIKRGLSDQYDSEIIAEDGPQWLAKRAIDNEVPLLELPEVKAVSRINHGQFLEATQRIYFVEQLKSIPCNQPHELLNEITKPEVFKSAFDDKQLVGHVVLLILIERAPVKNIHEDWLSAVLAIAGDPRIPDSHERAQKWWNHLPRDARKKVRGWLSGLDLKLFLEALEDFAETRGDYDMQRMFASRKVFLEGLHSNELILETRLFLSKKAAWFLRDNYQKDELPDFEELPSGDRSIIYIGMEKAAIIEGSHSCYLRIYRYLPETACVNNYKPQHFSYEKLTSGLENDMLGSGNSVVERITHNPSSFNWQRKAYLGLKRLGVDIQVKDLLTEGDYLLYKRRYGVE